MPDRGKVIIKAWEHLDAIMGVAKHLNYPDYGVVQEHCLAILALLKEQEAVEPIPFHRSDGTIFKYECRKCGTKIFKMDLFCRHCGQAVKWEC